MVNFSFKWFNKVARKLLLVSVAFSGTCSMASPGFVKGQVEFVRTHDGALYPDWAPPRFWFTLKGVAQAGVCPAWNDGKVLFVANDKQALSLLLVAQASGLEIAVSFDDSLRLNSWCVVNYITIGSSAPLY